MASGARLTHIQLVIVEARLDGGDGDDDDDGDGELQLPPQHLDDGEHIRRVVIPLADLYDRLVEYSKQDRMIVSAKLFHFAAGMRFAKTQKDT